MATDARLHPLPPLQAQRGRHPYRGERDHLLGEQQGQKKLNKKKKKQKTTRSVSLQRITLSPRIGVRVSLSGNEKLS